MMTIFALLKKSGFGNSGVDCRSMIGAIMRVASWSVLKVWWRVGRASIAGIWIMRPFVRA